MLYIIILAEITDIRWPTEKSCYLLQIYLQPYARLNLILLQFFMNNILLLFLIFQVHLSRASWDNLSRLTLLLFSPRYFILGESPTTLWNEKIMF